MFVVTYMIAMASLGWLELDETGAFRLTEAGEKHGWGLDHEAYGVLIEDTIDEQPQA